MVDKKINSTTIELALVRHLNSRINLIVPNVFWGLGLTYEADLVVVKPSQYAYEIEIKISLSDLKAEKKKRHSAHCSNKFKYLYFAVPENLKEQASNLIPERSGLFIVKENSMVILVKPPKINKNARKLNQKEINKLYELCQMRVWNLKEIIYRYKIKR
jgi:hypothetical protein